VNASPRSPIKGSTVPVLGSLFAAISGGVAAGAGTECLTSRIKSGRSAGGGGGGMVLGGWSVGDTGLSLHLGGGAHTAKTTHAIAVSKLRFEILCVFIFCSPAFRCD
jgi:hypothetical protein